MTVLVLWVSHGEAVQIAMLGKQDHDSSCRLSHFREFKREKIVLMWDSDETVAQETPSVFIPPVETGSQDVGKA